jgi:hypothetical protein
LTSVGPGKPYRMLASETEPWVSNEHSAYDAVGCIGGIYMPYLLGLAVLDAKQRRTMFPTWLGTIAYDHDCPLSSITGRF